MGLVDKSDMVLSFNDTGRKTLKWYKKLAFHLMDLMFYNSYILFKQVKGVKELPFSTFRLKVISQILDKYGLHRKRKANLMIPRDPCIETDQNDRRLTEQHFASQINDGNERKKIQRKCLVHLKTTKGKSTRKDTTYECKDCGVSLCLIPCFKIYHTEIDFQGLLSD